MSDHHMRCYNQNKYILSIRHFLTKFNFEILTRETSRSSLQETSAITELTFFVQRLCNIAP